MKFYQFAAIAVILISGGCLLLWYYFNLEFNKEITMARRDSKQMRCDSSQYMAFTPSFTHDGRLNTHQPTKIDQPLFKPGKANEKLAEFLFANRHCFSAIITQRAISDVWLLNKKMIYPLNNPTEADYGILKGSNTRVYQMHRDNPQLNVRTFEALRCGLDRLKNADEREIVLIAHDAHYQRAYFDLSIMHPPTKIFYPDLHNIPFPKTMSSAFWSVREFFVRPMELYKSRNPPINCRPEIILNAPLIQ